MRSTIGLMLVALAAAACGAPTTTEVRGLQVELDSTAPFVQSPDFAERLDSTIEAALDYWGGSWSDLDGTTFTLTDEPYVQCSGAPSLGCYSDGRLSVTTQDPSLGTHSCIEGTVLVHEIGHAVIGDRLHEDPRWMMMDELQARLSGRPGYGEDGSERPCVVYVSVWRHPLGTP